MKAILHGVPKKVITAIFKCGYKEGGPLQIVYRVRRDTLRAGRRAIFWFRVSYSA